MRGKYPDFGKPWKANFGLGVSPYLQAVRACLSVIVVTIRTQNAWTKTANGI
jgi:hypothetical protein